MGMLDPQLTTLAFCWRLERRDGVCLGFTTHDRDLAIDGLVYRASPGMLPSAVSSSDGFDAGGLEVSGALASDAIASEDLVDGRWDGAAVALFLTDWRDAGAERLALAKGELGDVAVKANGFEAELRGPAAALERPAVEQTSPSCRAELGDGRCRVDLAPLTRTSRIVAVEGETIVEVADAVTGADAYAFGRLRWLTGANSGLESGILGSVETLLTLRDPPPRIPVAGDLVEITQGCDKLFSTCRERFSNAGNFRGEPHLPGMDLLTRYGGTA
jgi:uncharacterized phage protein (TIGR02218 family)